MSLNKYSSRSSHLKTHLKTQLKTLACRMYSSSTEEQPLKKTALYPLHVKFGGKMVPYAGFEMPVLYKDQSHIESHNWVREKSGLFDVSHMLQHRFHGPGATKLLQSVTPSDLEGLKPFNSTLSVLLNKAGGIVDDTIISKHAEDDFYVVTNAGCRDKDLAFFKAAIEEFGLGDIKHDLIGGGLIALQGPESAQQLQRLTTFDLSTIKFGQSAFVDLEGDKYHVSRGGYTGEDGFEISIPKDDVALNFSYKLIDSSDGIVKPIGLAARDSLRLEAGMCLYGHELSEDIHPPEAALTWVCSKKRRAAGDFNGADVIVAEIAQKSARLRVGLVTKGPAARENTPIYSLDNDAEPVGVVTSGSLSPTLKHNIAMGYVPRALSKAGTKLRVQVRGKFRDAEVVKMPFVQPNYYR